MQHQALAPNHGVLLYLIGCSLGLHGYHRPRPIYGRHTIAGYYDHNLGQHLGKEEIGILKSISKNSQFCIQKFSILRIITQILFVLYLHSLTLCHWRFIITMTSMVVPLLVLYNTWAKKK